MRVRFGGLLALCAALLVIATLIPVGAADFASPAFQTQWQAGEALTPNFWGPAGAAKTEPYLYSGTNRTRLVQYFDKGRMERFDGVSNSPTVKVTFGLLATELITGQIQIADDQFMPAVPPPAIPIAGDPDNPGPTYATLAGKASMLLAPAQNAIGTRVATGITPTGDATGGVLPANPGTQIGTYDSTTQHNVSQAFADYRNRVGLTTIGYAKSEPFATTVKVAGKQQDVIIQIFERRVLTYTAANADAFKVEMGNIGQHYYRWRYELLTAASATPTVGPTTIAATATKTVVPTAASGPTSTATIAPTTSGPVMGASKMCPSGFPIKANSTTKQYLVPFQKGYEDADANNCFATIVAVEAAGYVRTATGFSMS